MIYWSHWRHRTYASPPITADVIVGKAEIRMFVAIHITEGSAEARYEIQ